MLYFLAGCLVFFGIWYNKYVQKKERKGNLPAGQTAVWVVLGNAVVCIAFIASEKWDQGSQEAIQDAYKLILLFSGAGLPMIVGNWLKDRNR